MRCGLILILLLPVSCATASPQAVRRPTARTPDAAFTCVSAKLADLGYTVLDADRASGFLRAERDATTTLDAIVGARYFDVMTVSVLQGSPAELVVNTSHQDEKQGRRSTLGQSKDGIAQATQLADSCAQ